MRVNRFCPDDDRKHTCDVRKPHEHHESGAPQVYPFRETDSRAVAGLARTRSGVTRELGRSVKDARVSYARGHTADCRGDLYRGLCH